MPLLENPRHEWFAQAGARGALLSDAYESAVLLECHSCRLAYRAEVVEWSDFRKEFSTITQDGLGDGLRPDAHKRPWSAPEPPRRLPRSAPRPPANLPRISHQPPSNLPGAALADPGSGESSTTVATVVNGDLRYPAPRASNSLSVSSSSQASSAATSSSRAASRAAEVPAKAAGSRP